MSIYLHANVRLRAYIDKENSSPDKAWDGNTTPPCPFNTTRTHMKASSSERKTGR